MNVLCGVEVALVGGTAFGADPLANLEILEFRVLLAARVAELARREKSVYEHDLCAVSFREVFQFFHEVYEAKVLDFLPVFPLEELEIQGFKADEIVLLTQFMGESPVPIVPFVLDGAMRSVDGEARRVPRI